MNRSAKSVLFLCTGNSARSILAEAILNRLGPGQFRAFSAGSHPTGRVNPAALQILQAHGFDTRSLRSKSWDEFGSPAASALDLVITVCDSAANETCPVWPGHPLVAHWGLPDPALVEGDSHAVLAAFKTTFDTLHRRLAMLVALPANRLTRHEIDLIAQREPAPPLTTGQELT